MRALQGAADVQQLLQQNAALQQQLVQERQEKEAAQQVGTAFLCKSASKRGSARLMFPEAPCAWLRHSCARAQMWQCAPAWAARPLGPTHMHVAPTPQLKSKYKQQAVEISKVYALMKNAYVRLRKEKGGAESGSGRARNAGRSSSRQGGQPNRPPSGLGDADMVGQASDSEEQQGSPWAAGRGRTADTVPPAVDVAVTQPQAAGEAEGGQPPLAAGAGQPDSSPAAAFAGQPAVSPSAAGTGPPEPCGQAMPAGVAGEQLAIPTAARVARPGSSAATGADQPAPSPASPTTWTQEASSGAVESEAMQEGVPAAPEPEQLGIRCSAAASPVSHLDRPGTAGEPGSGAALAGVAASAEAAPPVPAVAGAAPPVLAAVETAAADVAAPAVAAAERRPEQQQAAAEPPAPAALAMLPPPPRPHAAAPATSSEVPWRNRQQQQQQRNMPVPQPPAQPPDQQQCHLQRNPPSQAPWLEEDTQVTQAGSYRPLHEVLWSPPPQAKGQKRPAAPQPAEPPSRQPGFDTAVAPVWGSPGSQAAAAPAGPQLPAGGPAWKKVARPGLADQHDFITAALPGALQLGAPLQQATGRSVPAPPMQQQAAAGSGGAARTAAKENDAAAAAGGQAGSYKYQDVVRKKAEREKLAAVECAECARFFEALQTWGTIRGDQVPHCGHVSGEVWGLRPWG